MTKLFNVGEGLEDKRVSYLSGTGAPGGTTETDAAGKGSRYVDSSVGREYVKIDTGTGAGMWHKVPRIHVGTSAPTWPDLSTNDIWIDIT